MKTRVKICGITRKQDVVNATRAGADALGFVFYEPSPRYVAPTAAKALVRSLPPFVSATGLFVNPDAEYVREVLSQVPLDMLQFHGDESPEFCNSFGVRWIKAVRVRQSSDIENAFRNYGNASGLLVDAWDPDKYGGTGQAFNWSLIPEARPLPLILAGGLASDNVFRAVAEVRPWAVDVSGGVESSKGIKDVQKITDFINEVHRVDETD
ncbi:phosphoribosylanthranilate isomerase [Marinobacter panjinensis]|uniref:N-(5'-phosphoribosyl)anthranilate isomerase n=1 Tax=Marinobacter panjinensis TaxID=2576384 RepID=A0A4U6R143_9GAMM|nr:phosphoribosylanthranilate isomerase [Marinobacter panjinensis]MCR8915898.1 phosphoribosylanthranilate isomerase [Marinobacter panjinensis]TKV67133.1 phosphoribosylanthranilate isomerase [Marinobacter panjinensis]